MEKRSVKVRKRKMRRRIRKRLKYPIIDGEQIRLIPKGRNKLLKLFFSRIGIAVLLIFLQMGIIYAIYDLLRDHYEKFTVYMTVLAVGMVIRLFSSDMDSTARLTWLLLIMLFPIPGSVLLLFTETDVGHRAVKTRLGYLTGQTKNALKRDDSIPQLPEIKGSGTDALYRYLNKSGCFPIYNNTEVRYFPLGEDKFAAIKEELKKAKKYIFMEYFIIEEGEMWGSILKILAEKAQEGVDVRVMYDGMCEITTLSPDYPELLGTLGIKSKPFSPVKPFLSTNYNYRDHRKILVIDGKTAFTGGVNLADEYINKKNRFGHWKDTSIMLHGEAAQSFTLMFLQMWNLTEEQPEWGDFLKPARLHSIKAEGYVMPFCDSPLDDYKVGRNVYLDIINRAKNYVHIMTPYLILDNELESALKFAARRGVDVKIILPGVPDKKAVFALTKSNYKYLTSAGVKMYEYEPGFVHAKVFVSDDERGVVGTINLDYRSLYHHFECAAYLYRCGCLRDMERDYCQTLKRCRRVTEETIRKEKLYYKVMGAVMRLAAPLM